MFTVSRLEISGTGYGCRHPKTWQRGTQTHWLDDKYFIRWCIRLCCRSEWVSVYCIDGLLIRLIVFSLWYWGLQISPAYLSVCECLSVYLSLCVRVCLPICVCLTVCILFPICVLSAQCLFCMFQYSSTYPPSHLISHSYPLSSPLFSFPLSLHVLTDDLCRLLLLW